MTVALQALINGLLIGGIYVTLASGFTLSFGVLHIIDFAVGEWVMLGAFAGFWLARLTHVDPFLFLPLIFLVFAGVGYLLQPALRRVITNSGANALLMALAFTFGLSILFRGGALSLWGFNDRTLTTFLSGVSIPLGGTAVPSLRLASTVFSVAVTLLLFAVLYRTRIGLAIRAAAERPDIAGLMGIDRDRVSRLVYGLYVGLTAMSGTIIGAIFSINPEMGVRFALFAFFVVVVGGLGSVTGAIVAGMLLGVINSFVSVYVGGQYLFVLLFLVLYVILLVSPKGLLGQGW